MNSRGAVLENQLTALSGRVPFGKQGLAPTFNGEVNTMTTALTSVTSVDQALHPGSTIDTARRAVLTDLGNFLVAEQKAGAIRIVGH